MFVDIAVIIILLGSAIIAFLRGFIREVLTIFGIVGGMIASYVGGPFFTPVTRGWFGIVEGEEPQKLFDLVPFPILADALAYGMVLVVFVVLLSIISHFLSEAAKKIGLGALDRTLGVVFGLARGILVLGLLYLPFFYLVDEDQKTEWFSDSKSQVYLEATSRWISSFIPEDAAQQVGDTVQQQAGKVSGAREALEQMDILGNQKKPEGNAAATPDGQSPSSPPLYNDAPAGSQGAGTTDNNTSAPAPAKNAPAANSDGYTDEFREKMNRIIQENTDSSEGTRTEEQPQNQKQ